MSWCRTAATATRQAVRRATVAPAGLTMFGNLSASQARTPRGGFFRHRCWSLSPSRTEERAEGSVRSRTCRTRRAAPEWPRLPSARGRGRQTSPSPGRQRSSRRDTPSSRDREPTSQPATRRTAEQRLCPPHSEPCSRTATANRHVAVCDCCGRRFPVSRASSLRLRSRPWVHLNTLLMQQVLAYRLGDSKGETALIGPSLPPRAVRGPAAPGRTAR